MWPEHFYIQLLSNDKFSPPPSLFPPTPEVAVELLFSVPGMLNQADWCQSKGLRTRLFVLESRQRVRMPLQELWKEAALLKLFSRLKRDIAGSHISLQAHPCRGQNSILACNKTLFGNQQTSTGPQPNTRTLTILIHLYQQFPTGDRCFQPGQAVCLPAGELTRASQKTPIDSQPVWKLTLDKPSSAPIQFSCGPTLHLLSPWFHMWVQTRKHIWNMDWLFRLK